MNNKKTLEKVSVKSKFKETTIEKELDKVASLGFDFSTVFSDWLDVMISSLLSFTENLQKTPTFEQFKDKMLNDKFVGKYEDRFREHFEKYSDEHKQEVHICFSNAFATLMMKTKETQEDVLGNLYMERVSRGEKGQYFTPVHIADMMSEMVNVGKLKKNESVSDPTCGSGTMLISALKKNPLVECDGIDLDSRCAKMAALNMWLWDANATIRHGNALTMEIFTTWIIKKGGYMYES